TSREHPCHSLALWGPAFLAGPFSLYCDGLENDVCVSGYAIARLVSNGCGGSLAFVLDFLATAELPGAGWAFPLAAANTGGGWDVDDTVVCIRPDCDGKRSGRAGPNTLGCGPPRSFDLVSCCGKSSGSSFGSLPLAGVGTSPRGFKSG